MFDLNKPNDQRAFVHKSFIGKFVRKAVGTAIGFTPVGRVAKTVVNLIKPPARPTLPAGVQPALPSETAKQIGKELKFGGGDQAIGFPQPFNGGSPRSIGLPVAMSPCTPPLVECKQNCVSPNSDFGRRCLESIGVRVGNGETFPGGTPVGDAVNGRYGAALEPGVMQINRSVCLKGMTLGNDGLCYNKGSISNKERMWPRGRRPLLTGGDMRAIAIAARAGTKLEGATKRLRSLGMMKRLPAPRKAPAPHQHAKQISAVSV